MNIVVGITSGIAAYKIKDLVHICVKNGHTVRVVMTKSAKYMIDCAEIEKIIGTPIITELFPAGFSYSEALKKRTVEHIQIATWADIIVVAPATAHTIARMACGLADDFLTTMILATHAPILVCPSMNTNMWNHPTVQTNLKTIQSYGYELLDPSSGALACGTDGIGRLPAIDTIYARIMNILQNRNRLKGKRIMVTAGGTVEKIDTARVITNRSSGCMGRAIAEECWRQGADVLLLASKTSVKTYVPIQTKAFESVADLSNLIEQNIKNYPILFHSAAVSDFTVTACDKKIDSASKMTLELIPTVKILDQVTKWNPHATLIGFKAIDTGDRDSLLRKARDMIKKTGAAYIIGNDISRADIGFETEDNEVVIVGPDTVEMFEKKSKSAIAKDIVNALL